MSEVKVNKISPRTACGTVTLGDSGDTFTIPAGATITNNGTAAGFGATGAASWDTTVKTSGFTAVSGVGYFVNTTGGAISVNLPAGTAGDVVAIKDYANTFDTNNVTLVVNGSDKIGGLNINGTLSVEGLAVTLVYVDATKGWLVTDNGTQDTAPTALYVTATGGTPLTSGDYKVHVFTGPGTFCVSCAGNPSGSTTLEYLVAAGGANAGSTIEASSYASGGGGAGGFRLFTTAPGSNSPFNAPAGLTASVQGYPIIVGGGGSFPGNGSPSTFSTITSAGGGGGGADETAGTPSGGRSGAAGGSGGGGGSGTGPPGAGNTPPTSPSQGHPGSSSTGGGSTAGGGGGGAGSTAGNTQASVGGAGGDGSYIADTNIGPTAPSYGTPGPVGSTRYFAGGGGGGAAYGSNASGTAGAAGSGGGGAGSYTGGGTNGTTNSGGGGGGGKGGTSVGTEANGGSGIVIIRYKFQN